MVPPDSTGPSTPEIGRQVREALGRIEALAIRIDQNFVSNRVLDLHAQNVELQVKGLQNELAATSRGLEGKADRIELAELKARVMSLEDEKKWLQRLVIGLVITAVVGLILTVPQVLTR